MAGWPRAAPGQPKCFKIAFGLPEDLCLPAVSSPVHKPDFPGAPATILFGVGTERAAQLSRLGIRTVEDLLLHRPNRHEDRRAMRTIRELEAGAATTTRGQIIACGVKWFARRTKSIYELILDDGTARLHCRWWNQPFMERYFAKGDELVVYGKVISAKPRLMDHPETEVIDPGEDRFIHFGRITPIYPLTEGVSQRWLRSLIWRTLERFRGNIAETWPELQLSARAQWPLGANRPAFPSRAEAIQQLHFPESPPQVERARARLALDEFIGLQRQMRARRMRFEARSITPPCRSDNRLIKPFLKRLGFALTAAQTEVLRELRKDFSGPHPMRRLLQGDVGSGKTVVAACCALMALESGCNVLLMAPTEILAAQHYQNFSRWFAGLQVGVELHTGSRKTLRNSTPDSHPPTAPPPAPVSLVIGTHALVQAGFALENIGLVIIDEQHKFGVAQREELLRKGHYPHLLVMTATPIPRTLGLTLYGDLDVSVIDQMPPGRGRVRTFLRGAESLPEVRGFIKSKLTEGRQAYVVYPRVEETDGNTKAVTREFETWVKALAPHRCGLLHGQLKPAEKESVMAAFRSNAIQILLATSLIEVGVDVANATVMVIENAEQFGLAQLHQLRGRIGRGAHESYCVLVAGPQTDGLRRLKVLEQTNDGFRIAEADLALRGPGELLGQQQSGMPDFRFGDLLTDLDLIRLARELARELPAGPKPG